MNNQPKRVAMVAMLRIHPHATPLEALTTCIDACTACAQTCSSCAELCQDELCAPVVERCIELALNCANICETTVRVLQRRDILEPALVQAMVQICASAARQCGDECASRGDLGLVQCQVCADSCRRCRAACLLLHVALTETAE
ncbi:MAG: four-helix bundle copper-binding protein [Roseiflexaceae bacterium]